MATYYVDPATGNDTNDGSESTPWATLQKAADSWAAGDTVYLISAGTGNDETPSVETDFDGTSGTLAAPITVIGVNSSKADDGTRYVIDGTSLGAGLSLWKFYTTTIWIHFKNIELNNAKDNACEMAGTGAYPMLFENVVMDGAANAAIDEYQRGLVFIRCGFNNCGGAAAFYRPWVVKFFFCSFINNSGDGCRHYHANCTFVGCIFHNNTGHGLHTELDPVEAVVNCVMDDNTDGIRFAGNDAALAWSTYIGNRITNNTNGINNQNTTMRQFENWNFLLNNTTNLTGNITSGNESATSGTEGYNDRANDDFSLSDTATLRRTAIQIPGL